MLNFLLHKDGVTERRGSPSQDEFSFSLAPPDILAHAFFFPKAIIVLRFEWHMGNTEIEIFKFY